MIFLEMMQRTFAGNGFDAPHARRNAAFFQNFDQSDLAGCGGVGAAAEFGGEVSDLDHAYLVAILLAEQRHGLVFVDSDVDRNVLDDFDLLVAQHFLVDQVFDVLQLLVFDRGKVRKVKAQMIGRDQRSRLLHVLAQHFAQPSLQQMRGGVVAHGGLADFGVDHGVHFISDPQGAPPNAVFGGWGFHDHLMRAHSLDRVVASFHLGDDGVVIVAVEPSPVADLAAGFGVERRVIEDDFAFFARLEFLRALTVADDGENLAAVGASLAVALELGFWELLVSGIGGLLGRAFPGGASALALLLHRAVETGLIKTATPRPARHLE